MLNRKLCTGSAVLACLTLVRVATAAPAYQILYHERLEITPRVDSKGQQHLGFDAYGRHFDVDLVLNDNIRRGVPANRPDIKPYRGTVTGQPDSWVRLTQTQTGWRGVISADHELYAIEPERTASTKTMMYRFADAVMPDGAGVCGTDLTESLTAGSTGATALKEFTHIAKDLSTRDTSDVPTQQLVVSVVADHQFSDTFGTDTMSEIVSRMDIVDGIWYSQVGVEVVLAPMTILGDDNDTFSATTDSNSLLAEVSTYRGNLPPDDDSGLTHLMTGRKLDANIIGIAYLGAVCDGVNSVSLSQSTSSTTMGALIAAHELGHNFNAIHDGVPGICDGTPQTYLMAPTINFSNQFSACSLQQISAKVATASCLQATGTPISTTQTGSSSGGSSSSSSGGGTVSDPTGGSGSSSTTTSSGGGGGGGGSLDLAWLAFMGAVLSLRGWVRTLPAPRKPSGGQIPPSSKHH